MSNDLSIGMCVERLGCRYVCRRTEPYTNRKGQLIDLFVFEGGCVVCGAPFEIKVVASTKFWNVRCPECIAAERQSA